MRTRTELNVFLRILRPVRYRHEGRYPEVVGDVEHPKPASDFGKLRAQIMDIGVLELVEVQLRPAYTVVPPDGVSIPLDQLEGRIATTLFVVYPPGIATVAPGERIDERSRPMLDYLKMFERASNLFPGFESEIQGVYRELDSSGKSRLYTYVVRE